MTGSIDLKSTYFGMKKKSKLDLDFSLMAILSVAIAVVGLSIDSPAVVIGAMLVSPLLFTILVIASALVSFLSLVLELGVLILLSGFMAKLINVDIQSAEIVERLNTNPTHYFMIAFFAGIAGTFAYYWPDIQEAITGVAISVALIPPIAMVGIGLTNISENVLQTSLEILLINLWGIFVGAVITLLSLKLRERYVRTREESRETIEK